MANPPTPLKLSRDAALPRLTVEHMHIAAILFGERNLILEKKRDTSAYSTSFYILKHSFHDSLY